MHKTLWSSTERTPPLFDMVFGTRAIFIKNNNPIAIQITIISSFSFSNFIPIPTITYLIRFMVGPGSHDDVSFPPKSVLFQTQIFLRTSSTTLSTRNLVLVDLHQVVTSESLPWPTAWRSTAQGASHGGEPLLAESHNTIHSWLRRLRLGRCEGHGTNRVLFNLFFLSKNSRKGDSSDRNIS